MIHALVPAGGLSTRMGQPKLLLPLCGRTVLECAIATLRESGLEHILVAAAPHVPELARLARHCGAETLVLPSPTAGMRETVELGLQWIEEHWKPQEADAWLLLPADHPGVSAEVVNLLVAARGRHSQHSIFVPTYQDRRGHPVLVGWHHVAGVRAFPPGQGLSAYLRTQTETLMEIPVQQDRILWNLNTRADYERFLEDLEASAQGGS